MQRASREPDPRDDLSGEDVRRKILILARAAGFPLENSCVAVQSLVPAELAGLSTSSAMEKLELLDHALTADLEQARALGGRLRFVARLEDGCAKVGAGNSWARRSAVWRQRNGQPGGNLVRPISRPAADYPRARRRGSCDCCSFAR